MHQLVDNESNLDKNVHLQECFSGPGEGCGQRETGGYLGYCAKGLRERIKQFY